MFKNHLLVASRNLSKHRLYGFINIFGLALGMACCLLLLLFVRDEVRFDRFHANAERTYRIIQQNADLPAGVSPEPPLAPALLAAYPEVEHATRLFRYWFTPLLSREDMGFYEEGLLFTDAQFFDVFSFPFVRGTPEEALTAPFSLVLTESAARKYFGDTDPLGQTLVLNAEHEMTVTAVLADPPRTSHFTFSMLGSLEALDDVMGWDDVLEKWELSNFQTYLTLAEGTDPAAFDAELPAFVDRVRGEDSPVSYRLQPLTDIHLYSDYRGEIGANSDIRYVWLLLALAATILLLACINYTNLATARFTQRAKEIGVRKAVGAQRGQLVAQFLAESMLLSAVALVVALGLLELLLPMFGTLVGGEITFDLTGDWLALSGALGIAVLTGLVAGGYPALFLSASTPRAALQGVNRSTRSPLRQALVVSQYAAATVLIVGAGVVYQQLDFIHHEKLGFDREQVVVVPVRDSTIAQQPGAVKAAFAALPDVTHVTATTSLPGTMMPATTDFSPEGMTRDPFRIFMGWIDDEYVGTLGMELVAGRNISADRAGDADGVLLLNETAVHEIGWASAEEALGKRAEIWGQEREIVGVVKDFHYASLREPIGPYVFFPNFADTQGLALRLNTDDLPATMARLEATWQTLSTAQPFTYSFLDSDIGRLYRAEERWGKLVGAGALVALLIACLGLFGLASFMAMQRTKEIGVRKVLGASAASVVLLLSKDFARLVGIALLLACPLGWVAADRWLDGFAYRMTLGPGVFIAAGLVALGIALLTVSYHAVRAATADPVRSLRYE